MWGTCGIGLGFERYTSGLEPIDGVLGLKLRKSLLQCFASARIAFDQLGRLVGGIRDVAPPSTGNLDLGEHLIGFFKNYDMALRMVLGG